MNLRDKRPTNYYKELCQQLSSGREVQRNEMNSDNNTQKKTGNTNDPHKQDKNNHKTAQLMVKLLKTINRHFLQLSLDEQTKIIEANKPFDIESFHLNRNKIIATSQGSNVESNKHGNKSCQISRADHRIASFRQTSRPLNYASSDYVQKIESQNGNNNNQPSTLRNLKEVNPIAPPKQSKGKKKQQKKLAQQSPQIKVLAHLSQKDQKVQNVDLGNEYSQECFKTFINTLFLQQKIKKQRETITVKSIQQLKNISKKITKSESNSKDKNINNDINRSLAENLDILRTILERKGSIGSQKLSTFFQLKRSSFHIAIAYRIHLLQHKKSGSNFQKFQELDPTRFSRMLKKSREANTKIVEEKNKIQQ